MGALNYNHLRYFWAVAHDGNLTRTAERLGVAQSALSIQIRKLEDRIGHSLFERRGKQLILTEAGRIVLDHADVIFAAGAELMGTLAKTGAAQRQVLRVGALATLSRNFQIAYLRPLLGRPDVEVVLRSGSLGELLPLLEAHRLDVVLGQNAPQHDGATLWIAQAIAEQPVGLVGTPERIGPAAPLEELLAREPLVLPGAGSGVRAAVDALLETRGIRPNIAAEVDDMAMMRLLAREGIGLAVVPPIVVQDELASGRLKEASTFPRINETFYAITLRRRFPNPLLAALQAAEFPAFAGPLATDSDEGDQESFRESRPGGGNL